MRLFRRLKSFFGSRSAAAEPAPPPPPATPRAGGLAVLPLLRVVRHALEPLAGNALDEAVRRDLQAIPPMKPVLLEVLAELSRQTASAASVARLIVREPALSAAVLRLANSSAYSPATRITSVEQAAAYVGLSALRATLLASELKPLLQVAPSEARGASVARAAEEIWTHSLVVAQLAERLAGRFDADRGLCGTLAILHDLGKLVILHARTTEVHAALNTPAAGDESRLARERRVLGTDHADLGAHLAARWGLPDVLVAAIRAHHAPHRFPAVGGDDPAMERAVAVVFVANQLAKCLYSYADDTELDVVPPETARLLGTSADPTDLLDEPARRAAADALLLAAASLGRPPCSTARLIRLTRPQHRRAALDAALFGLPPDPLTDPAEPAFATADVAATALIFQAAAGDARVVHSRRREDDEAAVASATSFLQQLGADEPLRWKYATAFGYLAAELRELAPDTEISLAVSRQDGRYVGCVACPALRFSHRFGEHVNPTVAAAVVRAECAGVLNLRWFQQVRPSADGGALSLVA